MALCKYPAYRKDTGGLVTCGVCKPCKINKARFWTFRIMMESRLHDKNWWTTITYSPEFVPYSYTHPDTGQVFENPSGTVHPQHIELFIKRVRKKLFPKKFRYFLVGEYGEKDARPHYHICVFGHGEEINSILQSCWTDPISKRSLGFVDRKKCRPLDTQNARYTCGYTLKKLSKDLTSQRLQGRHPEFTSHSLGIGLGFAQRYVDAIDTPSGMAHIAATGDISRTVRFDGRWWPLDRYLREKILDLLNVRYPGIREVILSNGQKKFSREMLQLQIRSKPDPRFISSLGFTLEKQYSSENAQKILNTEKRASIQTKEKPL